MGFENRYVNDEGNVEKALFFDEHQKIELAERANLWCEERGIMANNLEQLDRRFLKEMPGHFEKIFNKYPECEGYITSIRAVDLPEGVLACTGPYKNGEGEYAGAEIQFNKNFFGKSNYAWKIAGMESDFNWRGERWLAGQGAEGVITHEMAHAMALKINAEDVGLEIGEDNNRKYGALRHRYNRDSKIITVCNDALKELEISPRDIGKEVSAYANSGSFGEMFAECISRYETCNNPGRLSEKVHDNYLKLLDEHKTEMAS